MARLIVLVVSALLNVAGALLVALMRLLADLVKSPVRTTARVLRDILSLIVLAGIAAPIAARLLAPDKLAGVNWWPYAAAMAGALLASGLLQLLIDRPTMAQRRAMRNDHAKEECARCRATHEEADRQRLETLQKRCDVLSAMASDEPPSDATD